MLLGSARVGWLFVLKWYSRSGRLDISKVVDGTDEDVKRRRPVVILWSV